MEIHFNMTVMNWLADHRLPWLTALMQAASALGEVQGYILVSTLIYVAFDKTLAVRLSLLVTLTMSLNHVLKIIIKNPRPFITEGNYLGKWAVPPDYARDLAFEYSTPSGHAMAGASFYSFLFGAVRNRYVRIGSVLAVLLIGLSRPYLGVHYLEDILLGWAIGLGVGLFALRYGGRIGNAWNAIPYGRRIAIAVAASILLWGATIAINGWQIDSQPRAFLGYAGTVVGIVIGRPLELRLVDFDPKSASVLFKVLRFLLTVALALLALEGLGKLFAAMVENYSAAGYMLQFFRYGTVSVVIVLVAPLIFTRLGLAQTFQEPIVAAHG
jgi:membrane-associated phospholipid phosphatase